jgi:hypothetical protein
MPLLMTKKVDRQLLYLNEGAYAVYIEAADKRGGDPWVRWARNFDRCLPLTMWQHFGQPLGYETWERDSKKFNTEHQKIADAVRQGRVVVFPGDEYSHALLQIGNTTPKLQDRISQSIQGLVNL